MIGPRRLLAGAALAAVVTLVASACDSSPVAVSVNRQQIQQTRLNADLREYAMNGAFVKAYEEQTQGASTVQGASSGTYSASFVAGVLNTLISTTALHQYLRAHHNLPSVSQIAAGRAWESAVQGDAWLGFSSSFRDQLGDDFADEAQLVNVTKSDSALRSSMDQATGYLFTLTCVRQVGFHAADPDGQPDLAASLREAKAATAGGGQLSGGAVTCYSPPRLEEQGSALYNAVVKAKVDQPIAPMRTASGYQVAEVTHRNPLPFNEGMKRVTSLVAEQQTGATNSALLRVVGDANVWLNPQYGTWDSTKGVVPASSATSG